MKGLLGFSFLGSGSCICMCVCVRARSKPLRFTVAPPNCFDAAAICDDDYSACPRHTRTDSLADADEPERRSSGRVSEGRNDSKKARKTTHKGEERQRGGGRGQDERAEQKKKTKHKNKPNKKLRASFLPSANEL